jgi:Family of unknown function (DUF5706)
MRRRTPPPPVLPPDNAPVEAAEAWKAVGLVNDWVKHAETKAAATLTAAGVVGGVLYNLIKNQQDAKAPLAVLAVVCAIAVVLSAGCAITALWPRLRAKEPPTSALYFDHIARRHPKSAATYIEEFKHLVASPENLRDQLAQQIWANAHVARRKYRWAGEALVCLVVALGALAAVASYLALASVGVIDG